jgi:hypothetical protein
MSTELLVACEYTVFIGHADEPQVICLFSCDVAVGSNYVTLQKLGTVVEADSFVIF